MLVQLTADPAFVRQVRTLRVLAPDDRGHPLSSLLLGTFTLLAKILLCGLMHPVTLSAVIPKLSHLKDFRCRMDNDTLNSVIGVLEKHHPNLEGLFIT